MTGNCQTHWPQGLCTYNSHYLDALSFWSFSQFGGSQSVVLGPAAAVSPGNLLEMVILGPAPDLVKQKLWGSFGHPAMFLTSPPGDSNAHSSLRTTGLAQSHPYAKVQLRQCYCKTSTPRQGQVLMVICPHFPLLISMKYYCSYDVIINCFMSVPLFIARLEVPWGKIPICSQHLIVPGTE